MRIDPDKLPTRTTDKINTSARNVPNPIFVNDAIFGLQSTVNTLPTVSSMSNNCVMANQNMMPGMTSNIPNPAVQNQMNLVNPTMGIQLPGNSLQSQMNIQTSAGNSPSIMSRSHMTMNSIPMPEMSAARLGNPRLRAPSIRAENAAMSNFSAPGTSAMGITEPNTTNSSLFMGRPTVSHLLYFVLCLY